MIDYDATLQKFFEETLKFLDKRATRAHDKKELEKIKKARAQVETIAKDPKKYADYNTRVKAGLEADARAFMPNSQDNTVFIIYNRVLNSIENLNSDFDFERAKAQKFLLNMLKQMKYKNSTNLLKDFTFPFISPTRFAVKENTK